MVRNYLCLLLFVAGIALPLPSQAAVWGGFDSGRVNYSGGLLSVSEQPEGVLGLGLLLVLGFIRRRA